ncbi:MAG TPA: undecaprenyl-diphosphate phosphatase [Vicinamibacterales bacterium]|jgi:undecaprenyl-diphosphatase
MPTLVKAAVLGVIQGLTEFLPVSSTAHLILSERWMGFDDPGGVFTNMIQFGSILAVMWLYREKILKVVGGLTSSPPARRFAAIIIIAFMPALVAGAALAPFVKRVLYYSPGTIASAFILGGIIMLLVERKWRPSPRVHDVDHVPYGTALGVGACQALALVPGVSRSGATIVGGMMAGLDRPTAAEFSFFLAMPTMAAAFVHDLLELRHTSVSGQVAEISVGFVMAFLAALVVVKPFLAFVRRSGFELFAWYRIAAGIAVFAAIAAGWL